jgi:hypothetical protein
LRNSKIYSFPKKVNPGDIIKDNIPENSGGGPLYINGKGVLLDNNGKV